MVSHFKFIAENIHHWIHSVLMTYTLQRGWCSKSNRIHSFSNICSAVSHFLSINSRAVKMCSYCTFLYSSLYWPVLEAFRDAGGQNGTTRARLLSTPLSLGPSLPVLQSWKTAFKFFFFNCSKKNFFLIAFSKVFPFSAEKSWKYTHLENENWESLYIHSSSDDHGQWLQTAWSLKASSVQKGRGSSHMHSITAWHITGLLHKGMYFLNVKLFLSCVFLCPLLWE